MAQHERRRLAEYRSKRDLDRSGEPGSPGRASAGRRFVVQRHDASNLHFDFRLEVDGVLVSWGVPKVPSTDPRDKRLATRTENHPLDYVDFEGRIPEGGYGAGTVVVRDRGDYENLRNEELSDGIERGHIAVYLNGAKICGGFALMHTRTCGDDRNWLLVKIDDAEAVRRRKPAHTQPESVLSGRNNEDL